MSLDSHMIHTCVIMRDSATSEDPLGNPVKSTSIEIYSGICRLVEKEERVWDDERGSASKVTTYKLLIPCGVEIQERDRIKEIALEDGNKLEDFFAVKSAIVRRSRAASHLSINLERVS